MQFTRSMHLDGYTDLWMIHGWGMSSLGNKKHLRSNNQTALLLWFSHSSVRPSLYSNIGCNISPLVLSSWSPRHRRRVSQGQKTRCIRSHRRCRCPNNWTRPADIDRWRRSWSWTHTRATTWANSVLNQGFRGNIRGMGDGWKLSWPPAGSSF